MATAKIITQVETLARSRCENASHVLDADGTYLSYLIDAMQSKLGRVARSVRKNNLEVQRGVLAEVHEQFYAAVLRGVTTEDVAYEEGLDSTEQRRRSLERNSRSAFARTTKSTVLRFIEGGGDIRTLDPKTVSKVALRKAVEPTPAITDRIGRQIDNAKGALLRAVNRRARGDPEAAREELEHLMEDLQKMLDELNEGDDESPDHGATTIVSSRAPPDRGPQRTRVGTPFLHRGEES